MNEQLRVVVADDERPARSYLMAMLGTFENVTIVGEAEDGREAIEIIEAAKPDLALLDLQMPEVDGLGVVRLVKKSALPLVAFVTAYDEYAVRAFEMNAIDYLLKPVERSRLQQTLLRAQERLEQAAQPGELRREESAHLRGALETYDREAPRTYLERIPVRTRDEIVLLQSRHIASIVAEGELLHIQTASDERYTINYRLKDLEARLDPALFVRLGRGTLANKAMIERVNPLPGGTYAVTLSNNQQLQVSRMQSRILREQLLRL
ncbi:MAG: LytTR family DNA-binding domain-containing protein [Pyrinomonadaceae bacterium MAG19_C2-C3]|nr:LytTR family DNA-binding domain-containing protein [Pyrinomonadaceae bacterium MAG19_C2-C3]